MQRKLAGLFGCVALMSAGLALPACGDDDGGNNEIPLNQAETVFLETYCQFAMDCVNEPMVAAMEGDLQTCLDFLAVQSDIGLSSQIAGVNAGNIAYDGAAARQCLNAMQTASCDAFGEGSPDPACDEVWTGLLADGSDCSMDEECVGGWCDTSAGCPGQCDVVAELDEDCSSRPCASGLACDYSTDLCIVEPGPIAQGQACTSTERSCEYGTWCDYEGTGNCMAALGAGQTCYQDDMCQAGLYCGEDGMCAEITVVGAGEACGGYQEAPFCSLADGLGCVMESTGGQQSFTTCEPLRQLNEDCLEYDTQTQSGAMYMCDMLSGLYCDIDEQNMTGVCAAKKAGGAVCADSDECLSGYCDQTGHCYESTNACD